MHAWFQKNMPRINVTFVLILTIYFVQSENNGICHPENKKDKCCSLYYQMGDSCLPCNGSFGIHCSTSCPRGYCGIQCKEPCPCDNCDEKTCECIDSQKSNDVRSAAPKHFEYKILLLGIGLIMLGISVAAFICWIYKRKNRPLEVNCSELTEETYVEYDMIRESRLILDNDDDDDDLKIHTVQPCDNVDKQRRLSLDDNSQDGFYDGLRYNS